MITKNSTCQAMFLCGMLLYVIDYKTLSVKV